MILALRSLYSSVLCVCVCEGQSQRLGCKIMSAFSFKLFSLFLMFL